MVGGGLVGLTAALVLRHHGVEVVLVERRTNTSPQPKARRLHLRSMEVFRELGLADMVRDAARDLAGHDHMAAGRTLADCVQLPLFAGAAPPPDLGPELPCLIAQDLLEPVLREAARAAGADVRFGTPLTALDGTVADLGGDRLRAEYVVAADGARSPLRESLGITRSGPGPIGGTSVNVYFHADLAAVVRGREFNLCQVEHPAAPGALASVDGRRRWVFMTAGGPGNDPTDRDWPTVLRTVLGVPAPDLEVRSVLPWQPESLVADRFAAGRVFLAGDAAHVMPPWAAMGANTGIADAHDLGWMLAAVLRGEAAPDLLTAYDDERRPAAAFVTDQSTRRTQSLRERSTAPDPTLADPFMLATGTVQYLRGAVRHDGPPDPEPVTTFTPAGRVGTRVPHRWLPDGRSILDLAGPGWAVLTGRETGGHGFPCHAVDVDFLGADECLLLRPDDVVAWRGTDPAAAWQVRRELLDGRPSLSHGVT